MATLLSGTDLSTGTTIEIPANDIIQVLQTYGSTDCKVIFVSNKELKKTVILSGKNIDTCAFQGGGIDGIIPVVPSDIATVVTGTAGAGANTTITLTGQSATNDVYNNMYVYITEGTGSGQVRKITDYVGATKVATVENAWTTNPDNTSVYIVAETGCLIQALKVSVVDVDQSVFLYNENNSAPNKITLNADQDATAFVSYINSAIDDNAAGTYVTIATDQTVTGLKDFTSGIKTDTISESTTGSGVTADSVLIKDSTVKTGAGVVADVALKVNADGTGFYEVSATQLGIAIQGVLKAMIDSNGLVTSVISEQIVGGGVEIDSLLIKDGGASANSMFAGFIPLVAQQSLSGAGAIDVTSFYTEWTTTAADAGTMADGTQIGQMKKIKLVVDGGNGTLTPTTLNGYTTITFDDAGDYVVLLWNGAAWYVIENSGCILA